MASKPLDLENLDSDRLGLWHKLLTCYKGMERDIGGRLQQNYRQSLSRFDVLDALSLAGADWISVGELTNRLRDTGGSISALLNRIENEGLIARRLNPDDRRSFQVRLTKDGEVLHGKMAHDYTQWVTSVMSEFSDDERAALASLLDKLSAHARVSQTGF